MPPWHNEINYGTSGMSDDSMKMEINGVAYNWTVHQRTNTLPFLVLLHGFMGSGKSFNHLMPQLKTFCNPVTIDLLGHGKTGNPGNADRFSVDHQLADLHAIINKIDASALFLHGYSMGGRLALRFALKNPKKLSGLILESTNYGLISEDEITKRNDLDERRAKAIETDFEAFLDDWQQLPLFGDSPGSNNKIESQYSQIQRTQNPNAMANSLLGFGTAQMPVVKHRLPDLEITTLLLAGEQDPKYRGILSEMEQLIPRCKMNIIKDAAHRVHVDNPIAFLEKVKAFVLCASDR